MVKKKPTLSELFGNQPEQKTYEFNVDSQEVWEEKGDAFFVMGLHGHVDPNEVKSELEKMSANVGYVTYMKHINLLICVTDRATYERTFQTQLELDRIKKGQAGYTPEGYRELKPAAIPTELSDKVYAVHLNRSVGVGK